MRLPSSLGSRAPAAYVAELQDVGSGSPVQEARPPTSCLDLDGGRVNLPIVLAQPPLLPPSVVRLDVLISIHRLTERQLDTRGRAILFTVHPLAYRCLAFCRLAISSSR